MKRPLVLVLFFLFSISSYSQINNMYRPDRGQRGYTPMPKYDSSAYVSTLNIYNELDTILRKCK